MGKLSASDSQPAENMACSQNFPIWNAVGRSQFGAGWEKQDSCARSQMWKSCGKRLAFLHKPGLVG